MTTNSEAGVEPDVEDWAKRVGARTSFALIMVVAVATYFSGSFGGDAAARFWNFAFYACHLLSAVIGALMLLLPRHRRLGVGVLQGVAAAVTVELVLVIVLASLIGG